MIDLTYEAALARDLSPWSECLPPICKVSSQLYFEATSIYLNMITPVLRDFQTMAWLTRSLAAFPAGTGYKSIRRLTFRNFHGIEQTRGYQLIALCPSLRSLEIMFGDEYHRPERSPTPVEDVIDAPNGSIDAHENLTATILMYEMHRLFKVPNLKQLGFGFHGWTSSTSPKLAEQIISWLAQEFLAGAMSVELKCAQLHYDTSDEEYHGDWIQDD
ncbi:hypothetical protein IQ07DRAFT_586217 [Pyrenochaeta sp. DS3sAY3a]|nr:hypothetical protein IQ07DRAFT_586217 [Pyrenochaeta sp. DS3sAY3a]